LPNHLICAGGRGPCGNKSRVKALRGMRPEL
jgi:hypothetical protein